MSVRIIIITLLISGVYVCAGFHLQHQAAVRRRVCMRSPRCCPGHVCRAYQRFDASQPVAVCARHLLGRPLYAPGTQSQIQFCRPRRLLPGFQQPMFNRASRRRPIFGAQPPGQPGQNPPIRRHQQTRAAAAMFQGPDMLQSQLSPALRNQVPTGTFPGQQPPDSFHRQMPTFHQSAAAGQRPGFGQRNGGGNPGQLPPGQLNTFAFVPRDQIPFVHRHHRFAQGGQQFFPGQGHPSQSQGAAVDPQRALIQRPIPPGQPFPLSHIQTMVDQSFPGSVSHNIVVSPQARVVLPQPRLAEQAPPVVKAIPVPKQVENHPENPPVVNPAQKGISFSHQTENHSQSQSSTIVKTVQNTVPDLHQSANLQQIQTQAVVQTVQRSIPFPRSTSNHPQIQGQAVVQTVHKTIPSPHNTANHPQIQGKAVVQIIQKNIQSPQNSPNHLQNQGHAVVQTVHKTIPSSHNTANHPQIQGQAVVQTIHKTIPSHNTATHPQGQALVQTMQKSIPFPLMTNIKPPSQTIAKVMQKPPVGKIRTL